jgi:hypothetical protein
VATVNTNQLTFSNQLVGTTSSSQNVQLGNTSPSGILSISSVTVTGPFALTNNCPSSIVGGAANAISYCEIAVTFKPTVAGAASGTLTINSNYPQSPNIVALSGTGIQPADTISPASLNFGNQQISTSSGPMTITLSNSGTAADAITSIAASGQYSETNTCPASLAVGAGCTISVTFNPTTVGTQAGAVTVTDSSAGKPPHG